MAVDQGIHPVLVEGEVLPQLEGPVVPQGDLAQVLPKGGLQLVHGRLAGDGPADHQEKDQQQPRHPRHEQGVPQGEPDLDAAPFHGAFPPAGGRMAQPMPRTVWRSFSPRPSSIFFRRRLR